MGYNGVMRRLAFLPLVAGTLLAVSACSSESSTTSEAQTAQTVAQVTTSTVDATGAVVIDVRTPSEFASGHLEGAINIDVQADDFAQRLSALDPAGRYLVYCRSGNRSAVAVSIMRSLGFGDLTDLGGVGQAAAATGLSVG